MNILQMFSYPFMQRALIAGVLVSLCAALLGVPLVLKRYSMIGDGLSHVSFGALAIAVALLILRVAWQLMKMGLDELLEKSLPHEEEERILALIAADPAIESPHNLRTRRIGQNIAIEVHIRVDGAMTVTESHRLTVEIEQRLRGAYGEGTMVSIHVEPRK